MNKITAAMTDGTKASEWRKRARELLAQADILDPPYPCDACNMGWFAASEEGTKRCSDSCAKYDDWWAKKRREIAGEEVGDE